MSHQENPELTALAGALAALPPAARPLDRDRLLIQMGRASARPRLWQALTAVFALSTAGLGWQLATFEPVVVQHVKIVPTVPAEPAESVDEGPEPSADDSFWRLRERVTRGELPPLSVLPPSQPARVPYELTDGLAPAWRKALNPKRNS